MGVRCRQDMNASGPPDGAPDDRDAWIGHPEVTRDLHASFDEVECGDTEGAVGLQGFLARLDAE